MALRYNLVMLAVDLVAIAVLRRHKGLATWLGMMGLAGGRPWRPVGCWSGTRTSWGASRWRDFGPTGYFCTG